MNAGNANCATRTGDAVALDTARATAKILKLPVAQVLTASTGVIGVEMDGAKIRPPCRAWSKASRPPASKMLLAPS